VQLLIDGDPIVYAAGFAGEKTAYELVTEDADGTLREHYFAPKPNPKDVRKSISAGDQMKAYLAAHDEKVIDKKRVAIPEEKSHVLHLVNQQIRGIIAAVTKKYTLLDGVLKTEIVLTGPGNYRERLATIRPYKGNRDPSHKPFWYKTIREHMVSRWGAQVVEGHEADDEVSIRAHAARTAKRKYIVASIDKDLDQIPGRHYNYQKKVFYTVSPAEGERFFWQQVLSGDGTDNIPGCYGVADVTADDILSKLDKDGCDTAECRWNAILVRYGRSQLSPKCPYKDKNGRAVALETARLVYMQRSPRELWNPPGEEMGQVEGTIDD
jgi:hypothetical protein